MDVTAASIRARSARTGHRHAAPWKRLVPGGAASSVKSENGLCLEIFLHALEAVFPAVPGTLVSAKRCVRVPVGTIKMDLTGPDLPSNRPHRLHIHALHMSAEAVNSVVGDLDRVVDRIVRNDRQHRPEDLLLRNPQVATNVGEDR